MKSFSIDNIVSGDELGRYFAETAAQALDIMARIAGFRDFEAACDGLPVLRREIVVTPL